MFDSLITLVLSLFASIPAASAETMDDQTWHPKSTHIEELSSQDLYWVVAVLDGDTILVSAPNRELFQVRLLAVDTNEVNGPDSTAECFGPEAAQFTLAFLKNRAVSLTADPANQDADPFSRKLRYVDVLQEDGSFLRLNDALLREGMATYPTQYPTSTPEYFKSLEATAKTKHLGLWGACE